MLRHRPVGRQVPQVDLAWPRSGRLEEEPGPAVDRDREVSDPGERVVVDVDLARTRVVGDGQGVAILAVVVLADDALEPPADGIRAASADPGIELRRGA